MAQPGSGERGISKRPKLLDYIGRGGMSENEARLFASNVVRHARNLAGREVEGPAPGPAAVRSRREALQRSRQDP
jgi:hypothetical protein